MSNSLLQRDQSILLGIDIQQRLAPAISHSDAVIARNQWLFNIAEELAVPRFFSEQYPQGLGHTVVALQAQVEKAQVLEKTHFSLWQEPTAREALNHTNKRQAIITGTESHVCVLQTAMDLQANDWQVFVVADAVGSRREFDKAAALQRMQQQQINIVTAEMVVFEWLHRSATDEFRHISRTYLRD